MTEPTNRKSRRSVIARRTITLGTTIATAALGTGVMAASPNPSLGDLDKIPFEMTQSGTAGVMLVAGSDGEGGEGEGSTPVDPDIALLRDLGVIDAHLKAGRALYEAGDIAAAKTHMDQPIVETYGAVSEALAARGQGQLREQLLNLTQAAEAEMPFAELLPLYEVVQATINSVRRDMAVSQQVTALSALTRLAADEYSIAVGGETLSNLYAYQSSWGILQAVEAQAETMSDSSDEAVAEAAIKILSYLANTDPAFGDIQGTGALDMRASLIYGAAARIELAAIGLK